MFGDCNHLVVAFFDFDVMFARLCVRCFGCVGPCNSSDALLTPIFDAKRLNGGGGKRVRLKLLGDSLCIAAANSPDTEVEVEPYAQMELQFDSPRLHLLSTETEASKCFEVSPVDGPRLVAELEDRIELACHVSVPPSSSFSFTSVASNHPSGVLTAFYNCVRLCTKKNS